MHSFPARHLPPMSHTLSHTVTTRACWFLNCACEESFRTGLCVRGKNKTLKMILHDQDEKETFSVQTLTSCSSRATIRIIFSSPPPLSVIPTGSKFGSADGVIPWRINCCVCVCVCVCVRKRECVGFVCVNSQNICMHTCIIALVGLAYTHAQAVSDHFACICKRS